MQKKRFDIITFIILFFTCVSVIVNAFTLFGQSIRLDEAQSIWASTKTLSGILQYVALDVHVPLYEFILHFWLLLFGTDILYVRLLSYLFFIITLPLLYLLIKRVSTTKIALLTVALYSLSPFITWYSVEARMYSLFTLVVCLSHYFFLDLLESKGKKGQVGYFFATLFGLYTHYFFLFLLFSQIAYLVVHFAKEFGEEKKPLMGFIKEKKTEFLNYFVPLFLDALLFLPWIIYFYFQGLASNTQPLIPAPTTFNLFQTVVNFIFGFQSQSIQSILVALWPLAVVPIFFIFSQRKENITVKHIFYFIIVTMLPVLLVFFISYFKPIYLTRYLILVTPTFFLLLAWLLFHISRQVSRTIIVFFALIMFISLLFQNVSNATPVKENYKGAVAYLSSHASARDIIAITSPFTIYPIEYYYKGTVRIVTIPQWDVYSTGAIPPYSQNNLAQQMKSYQSTYQNIYIVLSYDQGYQASIEHYMDTHYKRLLFKQFSPGLDLREYQLRY